MTLRAYANGAVFVEEHPGADPPVVALHGWGRSRADLAGSLAGHHSFAVDLPGFGASPEPPTAWGASEYADCLGAVLTEIGGPPALLLGHSFGGRVAAHLGAAYPKLVAGIVFAGTPLLRPSARRRPTLRYRLARAAWKMGLLPDSRMEERRQRYGSADYRAASPRMREVLVRVVNEEYDKQLEQLTCPVAFVWGEFDGAAPIELARRAAEHVPHLVTFETVPGVGHDVHLDAPDRVREVLQKLLAEVA
ncbi:MAG: alpha/beta fold hydrolase [Acidimicrobiales bacterium]